MRTVESNVGRQSASWLRAHSEAVIGFVSIVLALVLGIAGFSAPAEIELTLFYLLIIAFAAWSGGKNAGFVVALISSLILILREFSLAENYSPTWPHLWNMWMQVGIYLLAARVISALRIVTKDLKWRVSDRAAALEREVVDRTQTEEQLRKTLQQLRQLAENMTDVFWMRDFGEMRFGYINPAYEKIWGRTTRELYQRPQIWLDAIHPEDRERMNQRILNCDFSMGADQDYRIFRADGSVRWIRERTFPVRDSAGKIVRVVGIAEDNTERRRLEREILEVSDREHARIGQDLHDSLCQKLVALAFDVGSLEQKLAARTAPETASVQQMSGLLDDLITEARATARGLFPVQLEADGLSAALQQLASNISGRLKVDCRVECDPPVFVHENATATHLYRIAQEALNNAAKYSRATLILVRLVVTNGRLELRITDNGVGVPLPMTRKGGMGLHIMEYRARMIGGTLSVSRPENGGTSISCIAPVAAS